MRPYFPTLFVPILFATGLANSAINLDDTVRPEPGEGRIEGGERFFATYDLCGFSCAAYCFCPEEEDPFGAFEWWLSLCGGSHLVPGEIKQAFDILSFAPRDKSSYKEPTKIKKHSGKKGDEGNPRPRPRESKDVSPSNTKPSNTRTKSCSIKPEDQTKTVGIAQNTLELRSCNKGGETVTEYSVVSTMTHEPLASRPQVKVNCSAVWNQSCHNYSAVIRESSRWSTFTLH
ncbi:hypothetical protein CEP51_005579 [Fusarium floridanum]|uniref:Uncharacterized protein n=1 Tax=Fusarium floridanum TaxID=1325733 RepID=A0A428RWA2_9HYPO|nr:hypothetical protein CEP51_005579 [Fusarium floridanum]